MSFLRVVGLIMGLLFIWVSANTFYSHFDSVVYGFIAVCGALVGCLMLSYGLTGKDALNVLYYRITGRKFNYRA